MNDNPLIVPPALLRTQARNHYEAAVLAISDRVFDAYCAELFIIAPNPFEQGRANQRGMWRRNVLERSRRMVWC